MISPHDSARTSLAVQPFNIGALPRIVFGHGVFSGLAGELSSFGREVMVVTGGHSFLASRHWPLLQKQLAENGMSWSLVRVRGEPSPTQVDDVVRHHTSHVPDVVVGIGGGGALDAGKAIAGLLNCRQPVKAVLEGVGDPESYQGPSVPFVAVPTTAGTGSELTRNAVITETGSHGYKKSFRNDQLLARLALVDPQLLESCPPAVMLANALDAVTQLIESYVSVRASVLTDALALDGLSAFAKGFKPDPQNPVLDYSQLAYAAMISGICLTQAGLGSVHAIASPLGAMFAVPHGTACGTMLSVCTDMNVQRLQENAPDHPALTKYARVAGLLSPANAGEATCADLVALLHDWTARCGIPRLSEMGVGAGDLPRLVAATGGSNLKTNPVDLTDGELEILLRLRL
ncbi:iron-containing alcohol dehydrogenase [Marinobacter caseinilyticus]|uniref:iron-containing alcohol dehydrogenase n=1 Tax=Marinobacter caseinilyticus TaxID=2692195 RepID=UPI0014082AEB|nr:iron-containing alcohol dehydrogenase [Marinobacter caseinilyticus]